MHFDLSRLMNGILLRLHPEILKRAPLVYIASLLQMTPETLSRVRSSLL